MRGVRAAPIMHPTQCVQVGLACGAVAGAAGCYGHGGAPLWLLVAMYTVAAAAHGVYRRAGCTIAPGDTRGIALLSVAAVGVGGVIAVVLWWVVAALAPVLAVGALVMLVATVVRGVTDVVAPARQ